MTKNTFSLVIFLIAIMASSHVVAAECAGGILDNIVVECYVDTPGFDTYSEDYCYGEIPSSSYAYFRLTAASQSYFGDSSSPSFDGWTPSCTSVIGSGYSSVCEKSIGIYATIVRKALITPQGGSQCTVSAIAEAESSN